MKNLILVLTTMVAIAAAAPAVVPRQSKPGDKQGPSDSGKPVEPSYPPETPWWWTPEPQGKPVAPTKPNAPAY